MTNPIPEKYREDEEIIRQTVEQIKKDFGAALAELNFSGNKQVLFDELAQQLATALTLIYKNSVTAFRTLLYRVDITEKDFIKTGHSMEQLAEMIIRREFQKVLTRKYFSKRT